MPITSRFVVLSTIALLAVGLLTLLGIVGMTVWLGERSRVYFNDVIEARDTRGFAVELRTALQTAESSQRGYLLTGNEIYLAPYGTSKTIAQRSVVGLKQELARFPQTQAMLERLTSVFEDKFKEMDGTIALKGDRKDAEAMAIVQTNRGKALMDEANVFLSGIVRAADERLTTGVREQTANAFGLRLASIIGGVLIVLVVGGAAVAVLRYTKEVVSTRDQVGLLNASLESRVEERTAALARANSEVQRFAYIVTHDLRAPLVNIMGFTSELEGSVKSLQALIDKSNAAIDPTDPVAKQARLAATVDIPEAIDFIRSSTRKMDGLIKAILKLSREGRRQLRPETIELKQLVDASAAAIQHQLAEAGGAIDVSLQVGTVVTDRLALEQIIGNILDNAVKFRAADRPLRIHLRAASASPSMIGIDIADNGRGIAERDLERVFELFRRSGAQDVPGEGIGLAHVRSLVRNLGGHVTLTSVENEGTTFHIVLPRELKLLESVHA